MSNFSERKRLTKNKRQQAGLATLIGGLMLGLSPAAFAAGTPANTTVTNSYMLDYTAGGVAQNTVSNVDDAVTFTVDRVVDLTVTALGDEIVVPGAVDQDLIFSVANMGNDLQAYKLRVMNHSSDDFDVSNVQILTALDDRDGVFEPGADDGNFSVLDGEAITDDLPTDGLIWVTIRSSIPSGRGIDSGAVGEVTLIAETLEPSTSSSPHSLIIVRDAEGTDRTDTWLADTSGTAFEMAKQGDHSATNSFQIDMPQLTASAEFRVHHQDGIECENLVGPSMEGYAIPGACVEYTYIFRNSADVTTAENINFTNTLDTTLKFAMADMSGFNGGTIEMPSFEEDCGLTDCNIAISDAALAAGDVATLTIRALLK